MKKNDIFTFTAPNGVEVTAVVVKVIETTIPAKIDPYWKERVMMYVCYSQNRLFTMTAKIEGKIFIQKVGTPEYGEVIVDYCVLPDYDNMLELYTSKQRQIEEAWNNYPLIKDYYFPVEDCFREEGYLDHWWIDGYYFKQIADDFNKAEEERHHHKYTDEELQAAFDNFCSNRRAQIIRIGKEARHKGLDVTDPLIGKFFRTYKLSSAEAQVFWFAFFGVHV